MKTRRFPNTSFIKCPLPAMLFLMAIAGCTEKEPPGTAGTQSTHNTAEVLEAPSMIPVRFTDITTSAGIKFKHNNGANGLTLMPESMGAGVAFIDYDNDGRQDIYLVNSRDWTQAEINAYKNGTGRRHTSVIPKPPPRRHTTGALYRNIGNGTFRDVTKGSGLDIETYGMGAAVGDYDNDGRPDLYVTSYGKNSLFHNEGGGKFRDVAAIAGVSGGGWSSSAMWLDYDKDGLLDLFVCRYVNWKPAIDNSNFSATGAKVYASPDIFKGQLAYIYRNQGQGRFKDVSVQTGISGRGVDQRAMEMASKGLGVALCDYNNDEWPDIVIANDRTRNFLYRNNKNGTFSEVGIASGIAYGSGRLGRAGMGVDVADMDHSDRESIVISNFSGEMLGVYQNIGEGLFQDVAPPSNLGRISLPFLGFGCVFTDIDNDGWPDIAVTNGHVNHLIEQFRRDRTYAQRLLLFRNQGAKAQAGAHTSDLPDDGLPKPVAFEEVGLQSGEALHKPMVGRGLACADIDLDGDSDMIVTTLGGRPRLLRNDGGNTNHALRVVLQGAASNRSAIGALIRAQVGKEIIRRRVHSGFSYLSQSELPITRG